MVVVVSLARGRSSLAIGNIIGAAVSNILGAFSLGLLLYERGKTIRFDRSARIYSLVLLVLTTIVTPIAYFPTPIVWLVCGVTLIATFAIYLVFVGLAIGRGILTAPEGSDDDSDDDSSDNDVTDARIAPSVQSTARATRSTDAVALVSDGRISTPEKPPENEAQVQSPAPQPSTRRKQRTLGYHGFHLFVGFLAICLAGYVLSQAATNITDQFGISDVLFGVIVLAIATTLPEKFVAVMSGFRGRPGILVANCVGSNIFLLALCAGIIMVDTKGSLDGGNVTIPELGVLWVSTLALALTVWFGARFSRWIGALMLACYVAFIVLEFTVIHRVTRD